MLFPVLYFVPCARVGKYHYGKYIMRYTYMDSIDISIELKRFISNGLILQ